MSILKVSRCGAVSHAYCLMNNHYHLLLETPSGNLSQIMKHINGAYTNYFNIKRKRRGKHLPTLLIYPGFQEFLEFSGQ